MVQWRRRTQAPTERPLRTKRARSSCASILPSVVARVELVDWDRLRRLFPELLLGDLERLGHHLPISAGSTLEANQGVGPLVALVKGFVAQNGEHLLRELFDGHLGSGHYRFLFEALSAVSFSPSRSAGR